MRFIEFSEMAEAFNGKSVAVVGSGPSVLNNDPGFVDGHDLVVRINNYSYGLHQGKRTDIHYSFYGLSVKKTVAELKQDGVKLCICKCPNSKPLQSAWHERRGKQIGIDFRYIYRHRATWWFCDTYVPDDKRFMEKQTILNGHIPTTGFSAILDILECVPKRVYLTGIDFFSSGVHNLDQRWSPGSPHDPIRHRPELEAQWLEKNRGRYPISFDAQLTDLMSHAA